MTRKDYRAIANALRDAYPQPMPAGTAGDLASDYYAGRVEGWTWAVLATKDALLADNPRFQSWRFLAAAGYIIRADGSQYPREA